MWKLVWKGKLFILRVKCFFTGHNERAGNALNYEDDYCDQCYVTWPQDKVTLPDLLNIAYCWLAYRDWRWFENLDAWLRKNHEKALPYWWSL